MSEASPQVERVMQHVDKAALVELAVQLVDIPSLTGNEEPIARFLEGRLRRGGLGARLQEFETGRYNVIGHLPGQGGGPVLLFNGHIDMPYGGDEEYLPSGPGYEPKAVVDDGWLFGIGANNMKSALAAYVIAAEAVLRSGIPLKGDVLLGLVGGEIERHSVGRYQGKEYRGGGCGSRYLIANGGIADLAVIGEPTRMRLVAEHVGSVGARLTVTGMPAPLRRKDGAVDALRQARPILSVFDRYVEEYEARHQYKGLPAMIHMAAVEGGWPWRMNRVPISCSIYVEHRVLPNQTLQDARQAILGLVEAARREMPRLKVEVEFYVSMPGASTAEDSAVAQSVKRAHAIVHGGEAEVAVGAFYSDASHFNRYGIPTVNYGPSGRTRSGKAQWDPEIGEHICLEDLYTCCQVYAAIIADVCSRDRAEVVAGIERAIRLPHELTSVAVGRAVHT